MTNAIRLCIESVQYYRWLRQYGLNDSHSGNLSVRVGDTVWITPTGACADTLKASQLVECRMDAPPPQGASLDTSLHLAIYTRNPKTQAVMHSHAPHILAMTMDGMDFVPIDFEGQYYFKVVPVLNISFEDYLQEAPRLVAEALGYHLAVVVRGHGLYVQAENLNLAYKWTCSIESSAKLAYLGRQADSPGQAAG